MHERGWVVAGPEVGTLPSSPLTLGSDALPPHPHSLQPLQSPARRQAGFPRHPPDMPWPRQMRSAWSRAPT